MVWAVDKDNLTANTTRVGFYLMDLLEEAEPWACAPQ